MGIFFISQVVVGIVGNSSILFHYSFFIISTGKILMPKDLIIKHLTFANSLAIISRGIPQVMVEFELNIFLNDIGCKLVVYLYRVARGVFLYTTCLLSCFQAITISSNSSRWMKLKHRVIENIGPCCLLSWLVHLLLNIMIPLRVTGPTKSINVSMGFNFGYCSGVVYDATAALFCILLFILTDGLFLSLMVCTSGSMVSILYRHKRQVQYLHNAKCSPRVSPEARATQTILILVCTFVTFYLLSVFHAVYVTICNNPSLQIINVFAFLEICFPTLCPFIITSNNQSVSRKFLLQL